MPVTAEEKQQLMSSKSVERAGHMTMLFNRQILNALSLVTPKKKHSLFRINWPTKYKKGKASKCLRSLLTPEWPQAL